MRTSPVTALESSLEAYSAAAKSAGWRAARASATSADDAHIGLARVALHRRDYAAAAQCALDGLQRLYHNPVGHALLGIALAGMGKYERARDAFQTALSLNPNYPQAHLRLAYLLKRRLGDPAQAAEHFRLYRESRAARHTVANAAAPAAAPAAPPADPQPALAPALSPDEVVIVSGLPRSGTSMLMQMLVAGGLTPLTDGAREADEDNPLGYLEYETVKQIARHRDWLAGARGKVVKIVAPLLSYVPEDTPCRVVSSIAISTRSSRRSARCSCAVAPL